MVFVACVTKVNFGLETMGACVNILSVSLILPDRDERMRSTYADPSGLFSHKIDHLLIVLGGVNICCRDHTELTFSCAHLYVS